MATLYRQYRPQTFTDLSGQDHVSSTLQRAITSGRLAHAYLFYGPRGTGKTSTARILAKRLNCTKAKDAEPCGKCPSCVATQTGKNIDVLEIDAASNRGIDDIRALKEGINLAPTSGKYKVYIIDEVHMLTNEAFTALLKTLEEPVAHAIFILATTELHKVPETILSRCQVYRFRRAQPAEMEARLRMILKAEKRQVADEALQFIIRRSDGCYRDAESLLGQLLSLNDKEVTLSDLTEFLGLPPHEHVDTFLTALIRGTSAPALDIITKVYADGFDLEQFIKESITLARDGAVALAMGQAMPEAFSKEPQAAAKLPAIIRALLQALQDLAYVPEPLLAVHLAIVTLCTTKGDTPLVSATPRAVPSTVPEARGIAPTSVVPITPTAAPSFPATPQSQPKPRPTAVATATVAVATTPGIVSLEQIKGVWPQIIAAVKNHNSVASTFLRAMEPGLIEGNVVKIRAKYALHRNFFDKPDNQAMLAQVLKDLLQIEVSVRCFLEEPNLTTRPIAQPSTSTASSELAPELLATVKEVFGQSK